MRPSFRPFIDSHLHTQYSLLDSVSSPADCVKKAKSLGMPAVAISDHGTVAGIYEFYNAAKKAELIPLLGNEVYVKVKLQDGDKTRKYFHAVLLATNAEGYKNLLWLSSVGFKEDHYEFGRPIVSVQEILDHSAGLVFSTGCMLGIVGISQKRPLSFEESDALFAQFKSAFPGRMFVEVGPAQICTDWMKVDPDTKKYAHIALPFKELESANGTKIWTNCLQTEHNLRALALAKKHGLPTIVASDAHMTDAALKPVQDMLISGASSSRWHFHETHSMYSSDEAWDLIQKNHPYIELPAFEGMIDNTYLLTDLCKDLKLTFPTQVPKFQIEKHPLFRQGMTSRDLMYAIIKFIGRMPDDQVYRDRLKDEVRVICDNPYTDFTDYFLILADITRAAKSMDICVGPARGSAGGCLLSYLLAVTSIDPLKWNLSFTRFLNEGRLKGGNYCDIDLDFSNRDPVVQYVFDTYGEDRTAMVGSFLNIKTKNALKDIARWKAGGHLEDDDPVHKVTATIKTAPAIYGGDEKAFLHGFRDDADIWHPGHLSDNKILQTYLDQNKDVEEMLYKILEKPRSMGKHAGGVVITPGPIDEVFPTRYYDGKKCTQVAHKQLEKIGGLKLDLLGVNTLNFIGGAIKAIKARHGIELDPWHLPEEQKVLEPLWEGKAETVFQFDTNLVVPFLKRIKPKKIHDLNLITAICRPGGLESELEDGVTVAEHFVARYLGKEKVEFLDPILESVLGDTYGLVVYQESIQKIFEVVGGMTPVESDNARRAVGKKDLALINSMQGQFIEAANKLHGWPESKAMALWNAFIGAANYSFNRAHSCAYAIIAYTCCYLKYHYPLEWWASVLSYSDNEDIKRYLPIVKHMVRLPHVNATASKWDIREGKLVCPMSLASGVGPKAIAEIEAKRGIEDFKSFDDFYARVQGRTVHKGVITALCLAGCFTGLPARADGPVETSVEAFLTRLYELRDEVLPKRFLEATRLDILKMKMEALPVFTCDLVKEFDSALQKEVGYTRRSGITCIEGRPVISDYSKFEAVSKAVHTEVAIVGLITERKWFYYVAKSGVDEGKKVGALRITVLNNGRTTEFVVWPGMMRRIDQTILSEGALVLARGELRYDTFKGRMGFSLNSVSTLLV